MYSVEPAVDGFEIKRTDDGVWGLHFRRIPRKPGTYRLAIDGRPVVAAAAAAGGHRRRLLPVLRVKVIVVSGN